MHACVPYVASCPRRLIVLMRVRAHRSAIDVRTMYVRTRVSDKQRRSVGSGEFSIYIRVVRFPSPHPLFYSAGVFMSSTRSFLPGAARIINAPTSHCAIPATACLIDCMRGCGDCGCDLADESGELITRWNTTSAIATFLRSANERTVASLAYSRHGNA